MNPNHHHTLRPATRGDADAFLDLVAALAGYEQLDPPDAAARARLVEDAFGPRPRFEPWLVFAPGHSCPVGYAIVLETYSSFLARPTLYLEDLFVLPEFRGRGFGRALFNHCVRLARERGCGRMEWTCLDWNTRAKDFYGRTGAQRMDGWQLYRLAGGQLAGAMAGDSRDGGRKS